MYFVYGAQKVSDFGAFQILGLCIRNTQPVSSVPLAPSSESSFHVTPLNILNLKHIQWFWPSQLVHTTHKPDIVRLCFGVCKCIVLTNIFSWKLKRSWVKLTGIKKKKKRLELEANSVHTKYSQAENIAVPDWILRIFLYLLFYIRGSKLKIILVDYSNKCLLILTYCPVKRVLKPCL